MPKYPDARNRRCEGGQEQAGVFQSEYDGSRNTSAGKRSQPDKPCQFCLTFPPRPKLNSEADPKDEHHILRMRDQFIHHKHLCIVFECLSSNLYELIKHNQFRGLSLQLVKMFTTQLLDALTVLKEARLIHCDLKPENILLKR